MDDLSPRGADSPALWNPVPAPALNVEQVVHDYAPRVYNVARGMLRSDLDAEDVTQDVLLQIVRKLPTFRGDSAFPTWLHRVTVNAALAHRRKQTLALERAHSTDDITWLETGHSPRSQRRWIDPPDVAYGNVEVQTLLHNAIARLPEMYQAVFVMADVEELPNAEVAVRLGLTLPAVKSRLHRAREMLRQLLEPHLDELLP